MHLPFVKMHGIGNDFIMVDAFDARDRGYLEAARLNAVKLCDRKFGVGADGVIVVLPAAGEDADFRMIMFNPDGTESEMCGNGLRCFAKYVYEREYACAETQRIHTGRGILTTQVSVNGGKVQSVQVDMGEPILARVEIPVEIPGKPMDPVVDASIEVDGRQFRITCVSMGNPHCVVFMDSNVDAIPLEEIGPKFEHHSAFPNRINTEFVNVTGRSSFKMRVWERGVGETLGCGTGACAVAVAGALNGRLTRNVTGRLAGGDLALEWTKQGSVLMTGPATEVFSAKIAI
jgi:diaminopimelate epimerase